MPLVPLPPDDSGPSYNGSKSPSQSQRNTNAGPPPEPPRHTRPQRALGTPVLPPDNSGPPYSGSKSPSQSRPNTNTRRKQETSNDTRIRPVPLPPDNSGPSYSSTLGPKSPSHSRRNADTRGNVVPLDRRLSAPKPIARTANSALQLSSSIGNKKPSRGGNPNLKGPDPNLRGPNPNGGPCNDPPSGVILDFSGATGFSITGGNLPNLEHMNFRGAQNFSITGGNFGGVSGEEIEYMMSSSNSYVAYEHRRGKGGRHGPN